MKEIYYFTLTFIKCTGLKTRNDVSVKWQIDNDSEIEGEINRKTPAADGCVKWNEFATFPCSLVKLDGTSRGPFPYEPRELTITLVEHGKTESAIASVVVNIVVYTSAIKGREMVMNLVDKKTNTRYPLSMNIKGEYVGM